jgi:cytochrome c oxidase assembly factor CtaG
MAHPDHTLTHILAAAFFVISAFFVWRSFYGMTIGGRRKAA